MTFQLQPQTTYDPHYKSMTIEPLEYIIANKLGFIEGNIIKYVSRYKQKGGVDDLRKAKVYLERLIEMEAKS